MPEFRVRINGGDEQSITTRSGVYRDVAAASLAMLDVPEKPADMSTDKPGDTVIEIWYPPVFPEYGPYYYIARENEFGALVILHAVKKPDAQAQTRR